MLLLFVSFTTALQGFSLLSTFRTKTPSTALLRRQQTHVGSAGREDLPPGQLDLSLAAKPEGFGKNRQDGATATAVLQTRWNCIDTNKREHKDQRSTVLPTFYSDLQSRPLFSLFFWYSRVNGAQWKRLQASPGNAVIP